MNPKTVNTRIISGMLLCCEEKANQMQDEKTTSCNGNWICGLRCLMTYLIEMSKSNQSVHGFWIRTVTDFISFYKVSIKIFLCLACLVQV